MSKSKEEEIIGVLWLIAALLAFISGHPNLGYFFSIKAMFDMLCCIILAIQKVK